MLDLSRVIAGPYCATLMADLGADVVKVERPGRGDDLRAWRGSGMSATFAAINRNKRGIAVDLQQPEGSKLVLGAAGPARRRRRRELPAGCRRQARARVRRGERGEPVRDLRLGDGLRAERAACSPRRLQHDRPGHERDHGAHRNARASPDEGRRLGFRCRRGLPRLRCRERRARPSTAHRSGPAPRRQPAGLDSGPAPRSGRSLFSTRVSGRPASATATRISRRPRRSGPRTAGSRSSS